MRRGLALALACGLAAGCARHADPARPALWQVTAPGGAKAGGWLFGTIHALPRPAAWRTPPVTTALADADELVVEIATLDDSVVAQFRAVMAAPGLPPLARRLPPADEPKLAKLLDRASLAAPQLDGDRTWAAAIVLADASDRADDPANGVDRALIAESHLPVAELEGAKAQFAAFAAMPEASQRVLLASVVEGAATAEADTRRLDEAWRHGDMNALAAETRQGMLADPGVREALFTSRNRAWAARIAAEIRVGRHPFVAVGAAHMAGDDGLVALLRAAGLTVRRVE